MYGETASLINHDESNSRIRWVYCCLSSSTQGTEFALSAHRATRLAAGALMTKLVKERKVKIALQKKQCTKGMTHVLTGRSQRVWH